MAQKQAQFDASLQAKADRKAADEAHLDNQRRASLMNKDEEKDKGFFATVADVADGLGEAWEAAGKAVSQTIDTLQGDENNAIKFGSYVSPEKQDFYNTMMDYTKKAAINGARKGAKQYNAVGVLLAPVTGAAGMLTGTLIGINNMNKKR
ncbi:hypothetical protein [Maridesulfovibrio salexigens]|uniref:Uncharacterized protein n=1 Tax=Maridesulfovibrio salexigens (strain ATCC 14822 / DSM 2638 / NCIMB 8403 / VKM B-1763) TaxID=526222 RepID=C6BY13_MARSD|nr:hypothetical protein [Maridesulfovibrio salexigens]ACS80543.1 predicted protein [Maridesulfovibrio salexigens DSM 2638]